MYVCYLIKYKGDKLPPLYIGSTKLLKLENGYRGSIVSKKYKKIFIEELKNNFHLFDYEILSEHETRDEALIKELELQKFYNVVKSNDYMNESLASINGMFGRDVSGKNNPMFGKKHTNEAKKIMSDKREGKSFYSPTEKHKEIISSTHKNKKMSDDNKKALFDVNKDTFVCVDSNGNTFRVGIDDERYINGELTGITKGKVLVKNENNDIFYVDIKDERYINGELNHINKGKQLSDEHKIKIGLGNKGKIISPETREKLSKANKGKKHKPHTQETKDFISKLHKGRKMSEESKLKLIAIKTGMKYKESTCPYCGLTGRGGNMVRYHFENCKKKINYDKIRRN